MGRRRLRFGAAPVAAVILAAGLGAMLVVNWPGHLSVDSILQLHEGRAGVRETWAPAMYAWILGVFDSLRPGTGLYLAASGLLLFASLISLLGLRSRTSWLAVPAALALCLSPALLIYQGIVWKDVLFANLAIAGFAALAHAARQWRRPGRRWPLLALALAALATASLVRQNGLVVVALAAIALGWTAGRSWRGRLAWGLGGLAATALAAQLLAFAVEPEVSRVKSANAGLRILQHYDLIGALARDPRLALPAAQAADPAAASYLRANAGRVFSSERVDLLDADPQFRRSLWRLPREAVSDDWRRLILERPGLYLAHRVEVFRWVLLTPRLERCLPVHVGTTGIPAQLDDLGIVAGRDRLDDALQAYASAFYGGPLFAHAAYALVAAILVMLLLARRDPQDVVLAALLASALAFAASFFVISIACDYRYLYFLDAATLAGLLYFLADPRLQRRRVSPAAPPG